MNPIDIAVASGPNFAEASFRFWCPRPAPIRAILTLVPGSNMDARDEVRDPFWQRFAESHDLGLLGCCFRDHPHEDMNIEEYARAGAGSGAALLEAIDRCAGQSERPEAANAPLLLWGHSAGGQFNYEFACWKPGRVMAFVVNKGGYYYTHLADRPARRVPGLFFTGGKDEAFRIQSIRGIFAINQRAGAAWRLVELPDEGHEVGVTRRRAAEFFAEVLRDRSQA